MVFPISHVTTELKPKNERWRCISKLVSTANGSHSTHEQNAPSEGSSLALTGLRFDHLGVQKVRPRHDPVIAIRMATPYHMCPTSWARWELESCWHDHTMLTISQILHVWYIGISITMIQRVPIKRPICVWILTIPMKYLSMRWKEACRMDSGYTSSQLPWRWPR